MSTFLFILTVLLDICSVVSATSFIIINDFTIRTEWEERKKSILTVMKITMISSLITALFVGLFSTADAISESIAKTSLVYFIIAVSMAFIIVFSIIALIVKAFLRKQYNKGVFASTLKLITLSFLFLIISLIFSWLFS